MAEVDKVAMFRAAVQGVRRCLEIAKEPPAQIDMLCKELLKVVEGDNAEDTLMRFRKSYKRVLDQGEPSDIYFNAVLKAVDRARSEADAELWVMSSVNEQLIRRSGVH